MGLTICVDPGINGCGVAVFAGSKLIWAKFCGKAYEGTSEARIAHIGDEVLDALPLTYDEYPLLITECPVSYPRSRINPNTALVPLAQIGAYLAGGLNGAAWIQYRPAEWKGNTKKADFTKRIVKSLTPEEIAVIKPCSKTLLHNVYDACGLGLFHFGRL